MIGILTKHILRCILLKDKKIPYCYHLLFRVVEIQRIYEATATPDAGRCQPERVTRSYVDKHLQAMTECQDITTEQVEQ